MTASPPSRETANDVSPTVSSELKRLVQQSSHYGFGLLGGVLLGFLTFPVFTRIFSIADYGLIDLTQKVLLILTAVSKVGLQNSAIRLFERDRFHDDADAARRFYSTMFLGVTGLSGGAAILFAIALRLWAAEWGNHALVEMLSFASILIMLRAVQSMLWTFLRIEEKTKAYNVISLAMRVLTFAAVLALLPWLGASVRTFYAATIAVELMAVAAIAAPIVRRGLLRFSSFDSALFRGAVILGAPLILQELFGIILDTGDRGLVSYYLGAHALGFYSVAYGLSTQVNTLLLAPLGLAIAPIYMRFWNSEGAERTAEFLSVGLDYFLLAASLMLVMVTTGAHDAVVLLASAKYAGSDRLIPMIVAGLLFYTVQIFLNAGLIIHKNTRQMAAALAAAALLNMGLNCWLLPVMGLMGAAVATLIGYACATAILAWLSFRVLPLRINWRRTGCYLVASVLAWAAASKVQFRFPIVDLAAREAIVVIVFTATLYCFDSRVRTLPDLLWRSFRDRETVL